MNIAILGCGWVGNALKALLEDVIILRFCEVLDYTFKKPDVMAFWD